MTVEGYQRLVHRPKRGCWGCIEVFVEDVEHWAEEDGHCPHPEGRRVERAFAVWARELVGIAHDFGPPDDGPEPPVEAVKARPD